MTIDEPCRPSRASFPEEPGPHSYREQRCRQNAIPSRRLVPMGPANCGEDMNPVQLWNGRQRTAAPSRPYQRAVQTEPCQMNTARRTSMSTVGVPPRPSGGTRRTIARTCTLGVRTGSRWSPYPGRFINQTPHQTRKRLQEQGQVRGDICNIKSKIHCALEILPKSALHNLRGNMSLETSLG